MRTTYRQHTTESLLHLSQYTRPLDLEQELNARGYAFNARLSRFTKEPTRICECCGQVKPVGQSCLCFDNGQ